MYYIGQLVAIKQCGKYIRGIIVEVDTDFITLNLNYKKSVGTTIRVSKDSKDLIRFDFNSKEAYKANTEAFEVNNNGITKAWCRLKDKYKVQVYQNDEVITISVEDIVNKIKQVKSYQRSSLININININIFLADEIKKLKNKLKRSSQIDN